MFLRCSGVFYTSKTEKTRLSLVEMKQPCYNKRVAWLVFSIEEGAKFMAKNLKGKELGKGIGQRKDGLYYARCTNRAGKRLEK